MKYAFAAAIIAAGTLSMLPSFAAQLSPISPHQALANRGQCVIIEGVAGVRPDPQRPGIDVDLDGKSSSAFGYIEPQNQAQFPDIQSLDGQKIAIAGVVNFYLGRAEIRMVTAKQLNPANVSTDGSGLTHVGPEFARGDSTSSCGA